MKVYYSFDGDYSAFYELEVSDGYFIGRKAEQKMIINLCADDFYHQHDGWELSWPLEFSLHDPETKHIIGTFKVECEFEPTFSAARVEKS